MTTIVKCRHCMYEAQWDGIFITDLDPYPHCELIAKRLRGGEQTNVSALDCPHFYQAARAELGRPQPS